MNARSARASKRTYLPTLMYGRRSDRGVPRDRVCSYTQLLLTLSSAATSSTVRSSCRSASSSCSRPEPLFASNPSAMSHLESVGPKAPGPHPFGITTMRVRAGLMAPRRLPHRSRVPRACRSRGRRERVHRSLENRQERGFPRLPRALTLSFGNKKCYRCSRLTLLPIFPVAHCYLSFRLHTFAATTDAVGSCRSEALH